MIALLLLLADDDSLSRDQAREGYVQLFDGDSTFGWRILKGETKAEKGALVLEKGAEVRHPFPYPHYRLEAEFSTDGKKWIGFWRNVAPEGMARSDTPPPEGFFKHHPEGGFTVAAKERLWLRNVRVRPDLRSFHAIFDGKSLKGWKVFKGDAKREKATFTVVRSGALVMKGGPGDLQTEEAFDDFILQVRVRTNGKHLNSGVFFRCIPGEYQNGYECQIHNDFTADPPKKYLVGKTEILSSAKDYGTGAIYRRIPARKSVAKDGEWFTLTVAAKGRHLSTWVDGVQQVDWTDDRKEDDNPRKGYRAKAGAISLQAHDLTTDISFRDFAVGRIERKP